MAENTKNDIPEQQGIDHSETDLDLPDLPGKWEWGSVNHISGTSKVNVFFGYDQTEVSGQYGEIDNYLKDDDEKWDVHVRPLVEAPSNPHGCRPRGTAETNETFDSLDAAIEAVPEHIATYYEVE